MILSRSEQLKYIEKFAVRIAKEIVGGTITGPHHPDGDLLHSDGFFSEVKSCNTNSGAIIRKKQLRHHSRNKTRNYILVFHTNRFWDNGRWHYATLKKCRTPKTAEQYLIENINEVVIIGTGAMRDLYRKLRRRSERTHYFKSGPKTYIKVRPCDFFPRLVKEYGRSTKHYYIKLDSRAVSVNVTRIFRKL